MDPVTAILGQAARAIGIKGGIAIALGFALAFTMWRADILSGDLADAEDALVVEQTKHALTTASLDALNLRMAGLVEEGRLRQENLDKALGEVAEDVAPLRDSLEKFEAGEIDITQVEGL